MSTKLNRLAILQRASKLRTEIVSVPEWGGEVTIRELSAAKAEELGEDSKATGSKQAMVKWVIASAVNEDGTQMFEEGDAAALGEDCAAAVLRIGNAALKLSGFGGDDETAKN